MLDDLTNTSIPTQQSGMRVGSSGMLSGVRRWPAKPASARSQLLMLMLMLRQLWLLWLLLLWLLCLHLACMPGCQ